MMAPEMHDTARAGTSATMAAGRLFRAYERHCATPDSDTLFQTLTAMHSLNDRLKTATSRDFHEIDEFLALKTLRNFAHHHDEIHANVRVIPIPAISDLAFLCIVRRDQVERAIAKTAERWRDQTRAACETRFHWYGPAVNINPCLFNFMVKAYELLLSDAVDIPDDAVAAFAAAYRFEEENGHAHYVDGRLTSHAAEVDAILRGVVAGMPGP